MMKYRKKPVVIEAIQFTHDNAKQIDSIEGVEVIYVVEPGGFKRPAWALIETLEGTMNSQVGDYIIRGVKGEIYPCKPDIFEMTYEPVTA